MKTIDFCIFLVYNTKHMERYGIKCLKNVTPASIWRANQKGAAQMAYFGYYNYTLDAANRIIVPSRFREQLGAEAVFYKSGDGCLFLYESPAYEAILEPVRHLSRTEDGREQMRTKIYAKSAAVSVDRNGRLVVPADCIEHAGLKSEVVILGADKRIEVWDKDAYAAHIAKAETMDDPDIEF